MPIKILSKDPVKMEDKTSTAKWITKKPKKWITKKSDPKWITKKPKKMEDKETTAKWITKKSDPKWITKKGHKAEMDLGGTKKKTWITKKQRSEPRDEQTRPGGRAGYRGGGRTNLLEELGRVEAEPSNRNRRAEISRVHGELNRGYKSGGAVLKGKKVGIQIK